MSNEQVSSDTLLARIKEQCENAKFQESMLATFGEVSLHCSTVLALVECAEVLRELRYTPVGDQPQAETDAFWKRVHDAVDKLEAL